MDSRSLNPIRGITYQQKSGIYLLLSKLSDPDFKSLTLEDQNWGSFTLNFHSGKRIICLTTNFARPISVPIISSMLRKATNSANSLNPDESILIICRGIQNGVIADLKANAWHSINWWGKTFHRTSNSKFTAPLDEILRWTDFLEVSDAQCDESIQAFLPTRLGHRVSDFEIDGFLRTVIIDEVINKSKVGSTYFRINVLNSIANFTSKKSISYTKFDLTLDEYKEESANGISTLEIAKATHQIERFEISQENALMIVRNLEKKVESLTNVVSDPNLRTTSLQLMIQILKSFPDQATEILKFTETYLASRRGAYLSVDLRNEYTQEKDSFAQILWQLSTTCFDSSTSTERILKIISTNFDLTVDQGGLFFHTPQLIYELLSRYIELDFERNFQRIIDLLETQFDNSQYYPGEFDGKEHLGSNLIQSIDSSATTDRNFVKYLLEPSLTKYYGSNPISAWSFIVEKCLLNGEESVSRKKPDFLVRSALHIALEEFNGGLHSEEALGLLVRQMQNQDSLPYKSDYIFQYLIVRPDIPASRKWLVAKSVLEHNPFPSDPYIEQLVLQLAESNNAAALAEITKWAANSEFGQRGSAKVFFSSSGVFHLLSSQTGSKAHEAGLAILRSYVTSSEFRQGSFNVDITDVAICISNLIKRDLNTGIDVLEYAYLCEDEITPNLQQLIAHTYLNLDTANGTLLEKAYMLFLHPILFEALDGDIESIESKFTDLYARELIVEFAINLCKTNYFEKALELITVFSNDSDPYIESTTDDPADFESYQNIPESWDAPDSVSTVRGWCAYALGQFSLPGAEEYGEKISELLEQLSEDDDIYVRLQVTSSISELLTSKSDIPPTKKLWRNPTNAIAQDLERITFDMLDNKINRRYPIVMRHIVEIFRHIKTMSEHEVEHVLSVFEQIDYQGQEKVLASLLVYYADFRAAPRSNSRLPKLFGSRASNDRTEFDPYHIQMRLVDYLRNGSAAEKSALAWLYWHLPQMQDESFSRVFELSLKYLKILGEFYSRDAFSIIYRFIDDYIELKPQECYELWIKVLEAELTHLRVAGYIEDLEQSWSNRDNAKYLSILFEAGQFRKYNKALGLLLEFPESLQRGIDPEKSREELLAMGSLGRPVLVDLYAQFPHLRSREL